MKDGKKADKWKAKNWKPKLNYKKNKFQAKKSDVTQQTQNMIDRKEPNQKQRQAKTDDYRLLQNCLVTERVQQRKRQ